MAGESLAVGDVGCVCVLAVVPELEGLGDVAAARCAASGTSVFAAKLRMARLRCTPRSIVGSGSTACSMMLSGSACCSSESRSDFMANKSESLLMWGSHSAAKRPSAVKALQMKDQAAQHRVARGALC